MQIKNLILLCFIIAPLHAMQTSNNSNNDVDAILRAAQEENELTEDPTLIEHESKADRWYRLEQEKIYNQDLSPEQKAQLLESLKDAWANLVRAEAKMNYNIARPQCEKSKLSTLSKLYTQAPPKLKMVIDFAKEHPQTTKGAAFVAAQGCSWWCCPNLAYAVNLVLAGWAGRIFYDEVTKKKKEL